MDLIKKMKEKVEEIRDLWNMVIESVDIDKKECESQPGEMPEELDSLEGWK